MSAFYPKVLFNVVLIEPEIPNNTGNIGRTCVGSWARLHLVGPLGFSIDDKAVKRAGLDYWSNLDLVYHKSRADWLKTLTPTDRVHIIETGSKRTVFDIEAIQQSAKTGKIGDGKIFVTDIEQAVRIRTGEKNEEAL